MPKYKIKVVERFYNVAEFEVLGDDELDAELVAETRWETGDIPPLDWREEEGEIWFDGITKIED